MITKGQLGNIHRYQWTITDWFRTDYYYDISDWRATWKDEGGGVLMNQSIHQLDLCQWLFGMPDSVYTDIRLGRFHNIEVEDNANYGQMLDGLMSTLVEPNLIQPTFVIDYPKEISPLAKKHRNGDPNLVERFELFIGTAEFANAFTELNDPIDQRDRFESQEKLEKAGDDEAHPIDENFLQAIECGMPPTAGVGIGIDRLVMLLTENLSIKDVILFPAMRKEE